MTASSWDKMVNQSSDSDSDSGSSGDDIPLSQVNNTTTKSIDKSPVKETVKSEKSPVKPKTVQDLKLVKPSPSKKSEDDYDSDKALSSIPDTDLSKKRKKEEGDDGIDSDTSLQQFENKKPKTTKKKTTKKLSTVKTEKVTVKKEKGGSKKTTKKIKKEESHEEDEEDEEEKYKWWENQPEDDTIKWTTLKHNGVIFPPDYEPLPSHIKLYYDGKPVDLPLGAEEVAGFYAALLETDHAKNPIFQKNFFGDFLQILKECGGTLNGVSVKSFNKCDFTKIHEYFEQKKAEKKALTASEKKQLRLEKAELEEPYKFCEIDGRKEQVGNFRVEPPDLFRGRGAHPKTGKLKRRIHPEDIILNLGKDSPIPEPPAGHKWGEVRHDQTVQWIAQWTDSSFNKIKYVRMAANSSFKGQSDFKKFEKARELKEYIDIIRKDYRRNLKSRLMLERQKAVAIYLIDVFALRAGGEKSDDEADTVGCCSLRYEHVTLKPPNTVIFDFLGKDSIRYYQEVQVEKQVFKNLMIFKRAPKQPGHQLFDRLEPSILNKHLQSYMPGLTAKVFRTYNASKTMQDQLDLIPNEGNVAEKLLKYNAANRAVAILCNHQRTVPKTHEQSVEKATLRIRELIWQKIRMKRAILQIEPDELKKRPKFFAEIGDMAKEEEALIHETIITRETEKYNKKFIRENDKRKFEGVEEPLEQSVLDGWLEKVEEKKKEFKKELDKDGHLELKSTYNTVEKCEKQIKKLEERIKVSSIQLKDREENSEVSLGTSKINYIDPRLSVVFCKKYDVPLEKVFTKTLREKFNWAIESIDKDWRF